MNVPSLRSSSLLRVVAGTALLALLGSGGQGCSSKEEPTTSGGAFYQLSGGIDPEDATKTKPLSCPDMGHEVTVSAKECAGGDAGCKDKLILDGQDGATVTCSRSGNSFSAQVGNSAGYINVRGTMVADGSAGDMVSTDAYVSVGWSETGYRVRNTKCTIKFPAANNTSGKLFGRVTCTKIEHTSQPDKACSMSEINGTYFNFSNCK